MWRGTYESITLGCLFDHLTVPASSLNNEGDFPFDVEKFCQEMDIKLLEKTNRIKELQATVKKLQGF